MSRGLRGCAALIDDSSSKTGVRLRFIELGNPAQNAFVESQN